MEPFELKVNDLMLQLRGDKPNDERIVIVDIDERSLQTLGQWPWSRHKVAKILVNLTNAGAGIIGLDIVFAEPDASSPARVLADMGLSMDDAPDYDAILSEVIANTPTVPGYVFALADDGMSASGTPKNTTIVIERDKPLHVNLLRPKRAILNIPPIEEAAFSSGFFNTVPDPDGIVRSVPLVMEYDNTLYPALSLEMVRLALGINKLEVFYDINGIIGIGLGDTIVETDALGQMKVGYHGPQKTYRYISALDVYEGKPLDIEGSVVLLGTSAAGLLDLRSTPFDNAYPGVEVHANAIDNILNESYLSRPSWTLGVDALSIAGMLLIGTGLLIQSSAVLGFLGALVSIGALLGGQFYAFSAHGLIFATVVPLWSFLALFLVGTALNLYIEGRQKALIKKKFAAKVSSAVMDDIMNQEGDVLAAHEREITVFFSDVRNFTNISESLADPKILIEFMNAFMDPLSDIIIKSEGTIDKYMGDAIMAYWNAPMNVDNHADVAVSAALRQLHALRPLNDSLKRDARFNACTKMAQEMGIEPVAIGIGLNTGPAIVGEMGSSMRSDYTVIGDAVNLGARIESLCKYYGSSCQISHFTKEQLKGDYFLRFLDKVRVKGKKEPVEIWQIHDFKEGYEGQYLFTCKTEDLEEEISLYHGGIALYQDGNFIEALECFKALDSRELKTNKVIYPLYIQRCEVLIENPPSYPFDGIYEHKTKG